MLDFNKLIKISLKLRIFSENLVLHHPYIWGYKNYTPMLAVFIAKRANIAIHSEDIQLEVT